MDHGSTTHKSVRSPTLLRIELSENFGQRILHRKTGKIFSTGSITRSVKLRGLFGSWFLAIWRISRISFRLSGLPALPHSIACCQIMGSCLPSEGSLCDGSGACVRGVTEHPGHHGRLRTTRKNLCAVCDFLQRGTFLSFRDLASGCFTGCNLAKRQLF